MKTNQRIPFSALSLGLALVSGAGLVACGKNSEPSAKDRLMQVEACYRSVALLNKNYALDQKNNNEIVVPRSEGSEVPALKLVMVMNGTAQSMTLDGSVDTSSVVLNLGDGRAKTMRIADHIGNFGPSPSSYNSLTVPVDVSVDAEKLEHVLGRAQFNRLKELSDEGQVVVVDLKQESEDVAAESLMASLREFNEQAKHAYATHLSDPMVNQLDETAKQAAIDACGKVGTYSVATTEGTRVGYSGQDIVRQLKGQL